ncbi:MAG: phosphotransferase [Burkholderiales bacterium]|nr:phosphotransferase [Burkholderiales bacterium]
MSPSNNPQSANIEWNDANREALFHQWLEQQAALFGLKPQSVRPASADASFRRYFRVDSETAKDNQASFIIMDAPPDKENCEPFVRIAKLMAASGLLVPKILQWDVPNGFILLDDLGQNTMMDLIDKAKPQANIGLYLRAVDALLLLQQSQQEHTLPFYDETLLQRELHLFPDWYVAEHHQLQLSDAQKQALEKIFGLIVVRNLASPKVWVHRDFMPRNLVVPQNTNELRVGVLDFQDAVYGPITYDIASLMRDAFLTWEEDFVLEITIRYWERARKLGLMDFDGWSQDFGAFWRAVEWMGLQRHLKVAGIFARLTLRDGKDKYLADTPRFIQYIRHTASRYAELTPLLRLIDTLEGTHPEMSLAYPRPSAPFRSIRR